jgi:beta-glucanase (GH16 family)
MAMKQRTAGFIGVLCSTLLLAGCAAQPVVPTATAVPSATNTVEFEIEAYATQTYTPSPTATEGSTPTPSPTRTALPTTVAYTPGPPRAGMEMVFHDEFDGDTLDTSKWNTCYPWDDHGCTSSANRELEWYQPDEELVENGLLRLRAQKNPVTGSDGKEYPYTSGMITSSGKFAATYGWYEIRAKMPPGKGMWPAFWLLPQNGEWPPEIDVLEVLGDSMQILYTTLHFKTENSAHLSYGDSTYLMLDLGEDFHTYAVDWQKDLLVWYFDGQEVYRLTRYVPAQDMYILTNLAVGGNWPGSPDEKTVFPGYFEVDYIRVYR